MEQDLLEKLLMVNHSGDDYSNLKHSICRNIKMLLQTRRCLEEIKESYPEVRASIYQYGFAEWNRSRSIYQNNRLCRSIAELIRRYEPRLKNVVVERDFTHKSDNHIYFRIEGILATTVAPTGMNTLAFDSAISLTSFEFNIEESDFD